ncbi:MAG: hypothetical protein KDD15_32730, partial [Lewinella sp.]|nr:hypothetical protein [Lewinella sp.]
MRYFYFLLLLILHLLFPVNTEAQVAPDELALPEIFVNSSGKEVTTTEQWISSRRMEILGLFETEVYGKIPNEDMKITYDTGLSKEALGGMAISRSVYINLSANGQTQRLQLQLFLPRNGKGPYPIFLGLNFYGNHTVHPDPDIPISSSWTPNNTEFCIFDHQADEVSRGVRSPRWPVERLIRRGYGLAVVYSGDIDPDYDDAFVNGVHKLFKGGRNESSWGTISAWAWGLSRAMDYLVLTQEVDSDKVIVIGHSRLGKAALWAGAQDERFAMVISNDSGCGGAALSRRKFGERLSDINGNFPHWFAGNFKKFNGKEEKLPVDQHELIALIAPRPVYVASAEQDTWADPYGEYLSLYYAAPVYKM